LEPKSSAHKVNGLRSEVCHVGVMRLSLSCCSDLWNKRLHTASFQATRMTIN
jgi:hypothetical protein